MIANTINGTIRIFNKIPKVFSLKPNVFGYDKLDASIHYDDGFRDLVKPTLEANQYLTTLYFDTDNDIYTYEVATYSDEEIAEQKEQKEYNLYLQRQTEGLNLYLKYEAKWRLTYLDGVITKEEFNAIEEVYKPVRLELGFGQLKTAQIVLDGINEVEYYNDIKNDLEILIEQLYEE